MDNFRPNNNRNRHYKRRMNNKNIIIRSIVIALILAICSTLIFIACSNKKPEKETTTNKKPSQSHSQTTTKPKHEEDKTKPSEAGYNYGKPVPDSPIVGDTYFDDAIFIGDSRTEGFMIYTGLNNATFYTHKGLMVNTVFTSPVINLNGKKVSVIDAVKSNTKFKKAYIMLGINELGWVYSNLFIEKYSSIVDSIKQTNPNAQIYVQSLIPVTATKASSDKVYNNKKIQEYNDLLQKMAKEKNVYYVNVADALADGSGCIPEDSAYDGIHLKKTYCIKWLDYLKTHTVAVKNS
ncbi:MAG: GDSL-type esterase/lipase family protein [Oscillospiraceae bacterium]